MFVKLDGAGVLYQQLYHALRDAILAGQLTRGSRLPLAPYYIESPCRAGLLLGYASMTEEEIRAGIRRLATVLDRRRCRL